MFSPDMRNRLKKNEKYTEKVVFLYLLSEKFNFTRQIYKAKQHVLQ